MRVFIAMILILFTACRGEPKPTAAPSVKFPRYVHNACTGQWAVQTRRDPYMEERFGKSDGMLYLGMSEYDMYTAFGSLSSHKGDTVNDVALGGEMTFPSRAKAVFCYEHARCNLDTIYARNLVIKQQEDSIQHRKDSLFNCQHGYN